MQCILGNSALTLSEPLGLASKNFTGSLEQFGWEQMFQGPCPLQLVFFEICGAGEKWKKLGLKIL